MKKLNSYKHEADLAEIEYAYPVEYDGYGDGYYGTDGDGQQDQRQLLHWVYSTIRRHWLLILLINLLVTALSVVYVARKPNYYRAEARIQVNSEFNPASGAANGGNAPIIVSATGADPAYFATQLQVLEGAGLMRRVVKTLDLENNEDFLNPQKKNPTTVFNNIKAMVGFPTPVPATEATDKKSEPKPLDLNDDEPLDPDQEVAKLAPYVGLLKGGLSISPVFEGRTGTGATRLIDVEFTHEDPQVSAKIANAISDAYVLQNLEQKIQSNASAGDFLQKRVAELQAEIRSGEERLINYARQYRIIPPDSEQNTVVERASNLNAQLGQAENERIAAQTAYQAALQNQMWGSSVESRDAQVVALEGKLNDLRTQLAQLKTQYTDEWFEVVQTKEQITRVEGQLNALRKRATDRQLGDLKEKLAEATARERILRQNFEQQRAEVIRQNEAAINYKIIQQEIETNKSLLNGLLQRSRENEVILTGTPNNVLVLDRALVPDSPSGPERTRTVLMAFLASLGLGIGLAFLRDWLDDSVTYTEDIESKLGLPLFGAIPQVEGTGETKLLPGIKLLTGKRNNKDRVYDLELFESARVAESYLQLSAYLLLASPATPPKSVLITSAEEGEGKTITALNLATSMAKTKGKVLLIDADMRCPRVHRIKRLNNEKGLSDLLSKSSITRADIDEAVQEDPRSNLHILSAGSMTFNPGSLLTSRELPELLSKLAAIYDHVIIDSPPVLYFADSAIMGSQVDGVMIIVRDGVSKRQSILKAKKNLQKVGANVIGVVLNAVPAGSTNYYNYSDYESNGFVPQEEGGEMLRLQ